jgi:D-alanyl-lipoteichoic acid acyltransferase DltB (MBOAT superfamily)
MLFNYAWGSLLAGNLAVGWRRLLLALGVGVNLVVLGYYKYTNFFIDIVNTVGDDRLALEPIVLPLGISFLTFLQIAYLVDSYRGEVKERGFIHYCLFVTFFPKLIMGPIVRHNEIFPQLQTPYSLGIKSENIAVGLTIFFIGLFKKTILADNIAEFATPVFSAAENGSLINVTDAWTGSLAYTFQLYFDFSGYTDMAIGVSRLFGIVLPLNFYSPYKALNILDFWRRWHMTLSRFLRDYLYIPLGGNRKGEPRYYINLLLTMTLCGLWHGAGWTFVLWGFCHGVLMTFNHAWQKLMDGLGFNREQRYYKSIAWFLTFIALVCLWVLFRAETIGGAFCVLKGMAGVNGLQFGYQLVESGSFYWILASFVIVLLMPNTHQFMSAYHSVPAGIKTEETSRWVWAPSLKWALISAFMAVCSFLSLSTVTEFIYFQF